MSHTYFGLRWGLAVVAFFLPIVIRAWESGMDWDRSSTALPRSISGYYHTGSRNYLVGSLIVIGSCLFLYKGFSKWENYLLNVAGIAAALVAFFPTTCDEGATQCATFTAQAVHGLCAIIAFGSVGIVAVFLGSSTLDEIDPGRKAWKTGYRIAYIVLGALMIGLPLITWRLSYMNVASLYWIEWSALWVFVAYWIVKTIEFRATSSGCRWSALRAWRGRGDPKPETCCGGDVTGCVVPAGSTPLGRPDSGAKDAKDAT